MPARPICLEVCKLIVHHYENVRGATYETTAAVFGVGRASVDRILNRFRSTGSVERPQPPPKPPRNKVDLAWLLERVTSNPDARLIDHAEAFKSERGISVSISAVSNAMAAIGVTHKKKEIVASERDTERVSGLRLAFALQQRSLDASRLIFIDESGARLGSTTRYGWAVKGKKVFGKEPYAPWRTVTMLGAIGVDGIRGFVNIESSTTSEVFRSFVVNELVPNLRPGDCVVMDNLSAHKDKLAVAAIVNAGASVMYLPPYSPDYNPIEKLWSKLKTLIRRLKTDSRTAFDDAVAQAGAQITLSDIHGWFSHCGYAV